MILQFAIRAARPSFARLRYTGIRTAAMSNPETNGASKSTPAKRRFQESASAKQPHSRAKKRTRKRDDKGDRAITHDDVLHLDLLQYMTRAGIDRDATAFNVPEQEHVDVTIHAISSTGDGLGRVNNESSQVFVVPFAIAGDVARVKAFRNITRPVPHTKADFISITTPSPDRDDSLVRCKYFSKCGGCQYQMLSYEKQLNQKRKVVHKAFQNFSKLPPELIPAVEATHASPLQYGFRTKLTPHFDAPLGPRRAKKHFDEAPPIGFLRKDTSKTMDIEVCPIGSEVLQYGLKRERQRVVDQLEKYTKGATILLRENTESRTPIASDTPPEAPRWEASTQTLYEQKDGHLYAKTCISDYKGTSTDYVGDFKLTAPSNSFFQNNNSILPSFIDYIRAQITRPRNHSSTKPHFKNLIDAYCGSGLFSITLGSLFSRTIGIDIDPSSIRSAQANIAPNAHLLPSTKQVVPSPTEPPSSPKAPITAQHQPQTRNSSSPEPDDALTQAANETTTKTTIPTQGITFIAASAEHLFSSVTSFDPSETVVILDPPRKGCDEQFLKQLLDFAPERIIYVSCNVHTQARDMGWLLSGGVVDVVDGVDGADGAEEGAGVGEGNRKVQWEERMYDIESLKGFDFFPQTAHVEGVAVLSKRRREESANVAERDDAVME